MRTIPNGSTVTLTSRKYDNTWEGRVIFLSEIKKEFGLYTVTFEGYFNFQIEEGPFEVTLQSKLNPEG